MGLRPPARQAAMVAADFQRVLAMRPLSRTPHFALHFAACAPPADADVGVPGPPRRRAARMGRGMAAEGGGQAGPDTSSSDLSTGNVASVQTLVDESLHEVSRRPVLPRLGLVVPKRWARRSVTRNLVRRVARATFAQQRKDLPAGDWVLRLRETIDPQQFISASSLRLKRALIQEMTQLFSTAVHAAARSGTRAPLPAPAPAPGTSSPGEAP